MMCDLYHFPIQAYPTSCLFELACSRALGDDVCEYLARAGVVKTHQQHYTGVGRHAGTSIYDTKMYCSFCREWRPRVHYDLQANVRCNKCGRIMRLSARRESKVDITPYYTVSGNCPNPICGKPIMPHWKICAHCMCDLNGSNKRTI